VNSQKCRKWNSDHPYLPRTALASEKKMGYGALSLVDMWWDPFSLRIKLMGTYTGIP
jgi:hypothetical protein